MQTVAIKNNGTGEITTGETFSAEIGQVVTVSLHDENGAPIKATGEVVALLESHD